MKLLDTQQSVNNISSDFSVDDMEFDDKISNEGVDIKPMDVLCGRGKNSFNHVGNRKFRDIVAEAIPGYVAATSRAVKSEIVTSIVRQVREGGGRFLKRDGKRGVWYVLNYTQSKEKAGHAIRDATITDESKKQRAKKRKLQRAAAAENSGTKSPTTVVSNMTSDSSDEDSDDFEDFTPIPVEVTPSPTKKQRKQRQQQEEPLDFSEHVKSLDEPAPIECLSSLLMAHFPEKLFPEEVPSFSGEFEPLPIDDPFNSYIDQLLGPLTEF